METRRKNESQDACVICLENVSERAITVPCNHYTFDFLCIASWLQERSTCPLCKVEVTAVQYDWRSPSDFKTYTVPATHPPRDAPARTTTQHPHRNYRYPLPRRPRLNRRPYASPNPDLALLRRRHVYRQKLYSLHVGSNRISRYQNLTPEMISTSPDLQSRAKTWIRRELRAFRFLYSDVESVPAAGAATTSHNAEFLLSYIVSIVKTVDIKASSGHAEDLLREFLGRENARLFLHELHAWLRSPYTKLEDWDRHVQYSERLPEVFDEEGRPIRGGKANTWPSRSRSPGPDGRTGHGEGDALRRHVPDCGSTQSFSGPQ
ncbi:hypothetical protein P154DRAFT_464919 [Amniculicola lignicola CBS 123094]|uniref:RING-type E3 ubiquitin transferase n=1 Tax=Amniculicola lignicola CBS 123094 TaxID=1392246 RepID=A0A6A5WLN5_9PLEO|nr:hypothetical protein P154DRAFT_464919 [Amniculicola lignicola CBS 123094]